MAKAEIVSEVVTIETVTLTLSRDEAQALRDVTAKVGADGASTRRDHLVDIAIALNKAGITYRRVNDLRGELTFISG